MQITPESKIPKLQVLLQFNSSNTSNLVNQASPGEAGTSLVSLDMGWERARKWSQFPPGALTWQPGRPEGGAPAAAKEC